jgi:hypothetical protein
MATTDPIVPDRCRLPAWLSWPVWVITAVIIALATGVVWIRYLRWQAEMIRWDTESIQEMYGGSAEEDRILQVNFLKEWEYKALKQTKDGKGVWLHIKLSKRYCGNLMLVDPTQRNLIRPFHLRHPEGLPRRTGGFSCFGVISDPAEP